MTVIRDEVYKGFSISTVTILSRSGTRYDGQAKCVDGTVLVTFGHKSVKSAVRDLRENIDYWTAPKWVRSHEAAIQEIERLVNALQEITAAQDLEDAVSIAFNAIDQSAGAK